VTRWATIMKDAMLIEISALGLSMIGPRTLRKRLVCSRLSTKNRRRRNSNEIASVSNNHADHIGRSERAPQAAANCHPVPPTSADGIEKYLSSGVIRGVGPVNAKKLVRAFGEKVFDVIETRRAADARPTASGRFARPAFSLPGPRLNRSILAMISLAP
jgi:hypothetical protein